MIAKMFTILTVLIITSCSTKQGSQEVNNSGVEILKDHDTVKAGDLMEDYEPLNSILEETSTAATDSFPCAREAAIPIIRRTVFSRTTFSLNEDQLTGIETVDFENGDKLIIKSLGCEYYVLTFRIETSRFQGDTTNVLLWLKNVHHLLTEIKTGINADQITEGIEGIGKFLEKAKHLELGEEIIFSDGEIRDYATVDRVEKINEHNYAIEISFLNGPY
jgi:hypothetical protein